MLVVAIVLNANRKQVAIPANLHILSHPMRGIA